MQKTKLFPQIFTGAMLSLTLTALIAQVVQARSTSRSTSLTRTTCVGSGAGRWVARNLDVAIGRAVYRSIMNLNPSNASAAVTCRIKSDDSNPRYQTLELGLGMLDRDTTSPPTVVNIYLDGQQTATRTLNPGQASFLSLDVSNASNVAIEAACISAVEYCSRVYIFKAELERIVPFNR